MARRRHRGVTASLIQERIMHPHRDHRSGAVAGIAAARQIVVFGLGGRSFGIDISCVREIRGWQQTTELPQSDRHMLGVINLRGAVVPVLDLQARLGFGSNAVSESSVVVVVALGDAMIGLLADAVSDIVDLLPGELRPEPANASSVSLLHGLAVKDNLIIGLIDLEQVAGAERAPA
jgi:purine-binding chemotaxis protein CheW